MFQMMKNLGRVNNDYVVRLAKIVITATVHNEQGVLDWVARAVQDASALGHLRDRDIASLERLEKQFNDSEYYRSSGGIAA